MELNKKKSMRIRKELKEQIDNTSNKQFDKMVKEAEYDPRTAL